MQPPANRPTVYVFYDYVCPYAYIGKLRADRLEEEFDVTVEWLPWEIHPTTAPAGEPLPEGYPPPEVDAWVDELVAEMDVVLTRPPFAINSHLALQGAGFAKDQGVDVFDAYHREAFDAVWQRGLDLGNREVLADVAARAGLEASAFFEALDHPAYGARLREVDRFAERLGIQRAPTFVFGDQRIVGNDRFEPSLRAPMGAFLERWERVGGEATTTLEEDTRLPELFA